MLAFTHIISGEAKQGDIVKIACPARLLVFEPVDSSIRKALIVPKSIAHSHPLALHPKATYAEKAYVVAAYKQKKAQGPRVAAKELRIG